MDVDPSAIDSPLALIALFVAMIELFLIYPLAKLEGADRKRLVYFVIGYPLFIASAFFVFLWHKPVNLYAPNTLSEELQQALLPEQLNQELVGDRVAIEALKEEVAAMVVRMSEIESYGREDQAGDELTESDVQSMLDAKIQELQSAVLQSGDVSVQGVQSAADIERTKREIDQERRRLNFYTESQDFLNWLANQDFPYRPDFEIDNIKVDFGGRPENGWISNHANEIETVFLSNNPELDQFASVYPVYSILENYSDGPPLKYVGIRILYAEYSGKELPFYSDDYRAEQADLIHQIEALSREISLSTVVLRCFLRTVEIQDVLLDELKKAGFKDGYIEAANALIEF